LVYAHFGNLLFLERLVRFRHVLGALRTEPCKLARAGLFAGLVVVAALALAVDAFAVVPVAVPLLLVVLVVLLVVVLVVLLFVVVPVLAFLVLILRFLLLLFRAVLLSQALPLRRALGTVVFFRVTHHVLGHQRGGGPPSSSAQDALLQSQHTQKSKPRTRGVRFCILSGEIFRA